MFCFGLPSKGRLQLDAERLLTDAGLEIMRTNERRYRASISGLTGLDVRLLASLEIAERLGAGDLHGGIVGEDLLRETWRTRFDDLVLIAKPLEFGHADVVVAVPDGWIDVTCMADLDDIAGEFRARHHRPLKVATKYPNLTRTFFSAHGMGNYLLVGSLGATEGAPAMGAADLIVDITTTGATLMANGLRVLTDGIVLTSRATLALGRTARWHERDIATWHHIARRLDIDPAPTPSPAAKSANTPQEPA